MTRHLDIFERLIGRRTVDDRTRAGKSLHGQGVAVQIDRHPGGDRHHALRAPVGVFRQREIARNSHFRANPQSRQYKCHRVHATSNYFRFHHVFPDFREF